MKQVKFVTGAFLFLIAALSISSASAEDTATPAKPDDSAKTTAVKPKPALNPWVDCGIGAMIFSETKWAAVTSNILWDYGTTAVTSASASPNTCESSRAKMDAALLINNSYEKLAEETATGQGEHLTALLNTFGCNFTNHSSAIQEIRNAMGRTVSVPGYINQPYAEKAAKLYFIADEVTSKTCTI